jgi:hypothetical protein
MAFSVSAASPDQIFNDGGHKITVTGVFEAGHRYVVHLGDLGTPGDPPCHSGVAGQGYLTYPKRSTAGGDFDTLYAYSPKVTSNTTPYAVTVQDFDTSEAHSVGGVIEAVKKQFHLVTYSLRKQPPHYAAGPRRIELEEPTTP